MTGAGLWRAHHELASHVGGDLGDVDALLDGIDAVGSQPEQFAQHAQAAVGREDDGGTRYRGSMVLARSRIWGGVKNRISWRSMRGRRALCAGLRAMSPASTALARTLLRIPCALWTVAGLRLGVISAGTQLRIMSEVMAARGTLAKVGRIWLRR